MILLLWTFLRFHGVDVIAILEILIGGFPIYKEVVSDFIRGEMTMELPMNIALVATFAVGNF